MNCVAETVTKMIEALPEHLQNKLLDEITPIISEALDEAKWEAQFQRGSSKLIEIAEAVKKQVSTGGSEPMDFSKLWSPPRRFPHSGNAIASCRIPCARPPKRPLKTGKKILFIHRSDSNVLNRKPTFGRLEAPSVIEHCASMKATRPRGFG